MNREKRTEVLKAMRTILEMVSNEDVYDAFDLKIPTGEEMEEDPDAYLNDKAFADAMGSFFSMTDRANDRQGYWCDGISSLDDGYDESRLIIVSARKIPITPDMIAYDKNTRWLFSGYFQGMKFIANSTGAVGSDKLLEGDDLLDPWKRVGFPMEATDERVLLRMLAERLKVGAIEGLTLEEAEAMERSWKKCDWKGEEW